MADIYDVLESIGRVVRNVTSAVTPAPETETPGPTATRVPSRAVTGIGSYIDKSWEAIGIPQEKPKKKKKK